LINAKTQAICYDSRHRASERKPIKVNGSQPKDRVVIVTTGKEIIASNNLGALLRRNNKSSRRYTTTASRRFAR